MNISESITQGLPICNPFKIAYQLAVSVGVRGWEGLVGIKEVIDCNIIIRIEYGFYVQLYEYYAFRFF